MPITVAALMTPAWLIKKLVPPDKATHIVVPGFIEQGVEQLTEHFSQTIVVGPRDCRDIPELFGDERKKRSFREHSIEIIAEINHAPRIELKEFLAVAARMIDDGADRIDVGCDPAQRFVLVGEYVKELVSMGVRVSIDTFDPWEAETAVDAGATLVLSVNSTNRQLAVDWDREVVAIPDTPTDLQSLDETIEFLSKKNVRMRLDPILEPIGTGLANSIVRYADVRKRYPQLPMMMGIGNLTELSDVDSAGVNLLLIGICQELGIQSVLTTEVINWARTSIKECDVARRLAFASVSEGIPPKNFSTDLVMLRDHRPGSTDVELMTNLAASITDNNYRLFASEAALHLVSRDLHLTSTDPFELFDQLLQRPISDNVDSGHAFYLGYELAKASIAQLLGKKYEQDQALDWGMLTRQEDLHRIKRTSRHRDRGQSS